MAEPTTKERLLDAAEKLFAAEGYDAVSIREIAGAADVNLAAVNYHFQGKLNLYEEVLRRRVAPKKCKLIAALDEVETAPEGVHRLEMLIRAFVGTHLEDALRDPAGLLGLHLMAREMFEPRQGAQVLFRELICPVRERMLRIFLQLEPRIDEMRAQMVVMSLVGQFVYYAMFWNGQRRMLEDRPEAEPPFVPLGSDMETYLRNVIDHVTRFTLGGIREICEGGES